MLILMRQDGEAIYIDKDIKLTVFYQSGNPIKLGIDAPRHINIVREELLDSNEIISLRRDP